MCFISEQGTDVQFSDDGCHQGKAGVQGMEARCFSQQLHFCFSAGRKPSSPQLIPPCYPRGVLSSSVQIPKLFCLQSPKSFHQLSVSTGFVFHKVIKCKVRPLHGLSSFPNLKFIIRLIRLI